VTLSSEQLILIGRWATFQKAITKVILFGSHYLGDAKPDSDIDLALWIGGRDQGERLAAFILNRQRWQRELRELLGATVNIELGDEPAVSVPKWIKTGGGLVVWERRRK
jgi:predicted nucleotidyltransferase